MNEVFILVKIIEIKYNLIPKSKKNAICNIKGILVNKSVINLIAYNNIADKCYRKLKKDTVFLVEGRINQKMSIEIMNFSKI